MLRTAELVTLQSTQECLIIWHDCQELIHGC